MRERQRPQGPRPPRQWLLSPVSFGQGPSDAIGWHPAPADEGYRQMGAFNAAKVQNDMANRVRIALKEDDRTNAWLAKKMDASQSAISRILRGEAHATLWHVEGFYVALPSAKPPEEVKPVKEPEEPEAGAGE